MNALATVEQSPIEQFVGEVLDPARMNELRVSLPRHIKAELFQRNLLNAVMINPELMDYSPGLLFREVSKAAALGLFLDPQLGEAYLVIAYNYKTKQKEPQLRIGYRGMIKLARQSGEVKLIYAHEVCANDYIECRLGDDKSLIHKPDLFSDRGAEIGYYAVVKYTNGEIDFEPMSVAQVHEIRDRSDGWKAFIDKKIKSTPWSTDEGEMAKKTALRRLTKRVPQSPELAKAIKIEDAAEYSEFIRGPRVAAITPPKSPSSTAARIEHKATVAMEAETHASEEQAALKPPIPPAASKATELAAQHDPEAVRKRFEAAAKNAQDIETLNEAWATIVEPHTDGMFPPDFDDLVSIHRRREHELEP